MSKETAFLVFCLENYKVHKSLTGKQAMELFCNTVYLTTLKIFTTFCIQPVINILTTILTFISNHEMP